MAVSQPSSRWGAALMNAPASPLPRCHRSVPEAAADRAAERRPPAHPTFDDAAEVGGPLGRGGALLSEDGTTEELLEPVAPASDGAAAVAPGTTSLAGAPWPPGRPPAPPVTDETLTGSVGASQGWEGTRTVTRHAGCSASTTMRCCTPTAGTGRPGCRRLTPVGVMSPGLDDRGGSTWPQLRRPGGVDGSALRARRRPPCRATRPRTRTARSGCVRRESAENAVPVGPSALENTASATPLRQPAGTVRARWHAPTGGRRGWRRWTGIEPARGALRLSPVLKTGGPTREPDTSEHLRARVAP